MGNWNISISGHGTHHNKRETDANVQAARFVESLLLVGHGIESATFSLTDHKGQPVTEPAAESIVDTKAYLEKHAPEDGGTPGTGVGNEDRIVEAPPPAS